MGEGGHVTQLAVSSSTETGHRTVGNTCLFALSYLCRHKILHKVDCAASLKGWVLLEFAVAQLTLAVHPSSTL